MNVLTLVASWIGSELIDCILLLIVTSLLMCNMQHIRPEYWAIWATRQLLEVMPLGGL